MENAEKKLTAVEWLVEQLKAQTSLYIKNDIVDAAKKMEKQQITDACLAGDSLFIDPEDYFYEHFGREPPNCLNCKFAGEAFELSGKKHVYCKHIENKTDEPLDNLMTGDDRCGLHDFLDEL
jgi:hypothetical protein